LAGGISGGLAFGVWGRIGGAVLRRGLSLVKPRVIDVNDVVQARHGTGLSQSEFASALNISKRTLK